MIRKEAKAFVLGFDDSMVGTIVLLALVNIIINFIFIKIIILINH